ncbi:MAG: flagellar biosynthesis protein FlhB [Planctomycetes bacterium]|nr:flagellar biosynthesis protein FlhB [Planctomycetota bacterium]
MGIFDDRDDKTEEATPKRREDARRKGNVAWSQDLSMSTLLLAGVLAVESTGSIIIDALESLMLEGFQLRRPSAADIRWSLSAIDDVIYGIAPALLPLLAILVVVSLVAGLMQVGGFKLSTEKISPKFEKLNPASGLKRLFSPRGLVRASMSLVKLALLTCVLWIAVSARVEELMLLPELDFSAAAGRIAKLALAIFWWIAVTMFVISWIDFFYQRWQHARDLRMSKQEIRDENKQAEGDPEVKGRIRRAQRELARRRMMEEVPKADVVLTNPTHYSVALRYERSRMSAPTLVAKGTELVALRIREIAKSNGIPIVEDPPLTRALYRNVELGDEIPPKFYRAVASILSRVMKLDREAV